MKTFCWPLLIGTLAVLAGCSRPDPVHQGKTLSEWIEALNTPRRLEEHWEAVDALVAIGPAAHEALISRLEDVDNEIRSGVATALLRIDRQPGLAEVVLRLKNGSAHVQLSMALALIRANVEPGLAVPVLAQLMEHEEYFIRSEAIKALGELDPKSSAAVPELTKLLRQHADANVRWRAAYALVRIGPGAAEAVPALIQALSDADQRVRKGAAYALGAMGPAAKAAEAALRVAAKDKVPEVRSQAEKALARL